jgi:hypothetical protein
VPPVDERIRALYEAHVAHELAEAHAEAFDQRIAPLSAQTFEWLSGVQLDELVTREQVMGVIDRFVIDLRISGGITELAGQMSQTVFSSHASADTRVDQLLSYEQYREYADKIESLQDAHREVFRRVAETRSFRALLIRSLTLGAMQLLLPRSAQAADDDAGPLSRLRRYLALELGDRFEERLTRYFERNALTVARVTADKAHALLSADVLRSIADELWDTIGGMRLAELYSFLTVSDIEDFVVMSYETWLSFRKTPFFRSTCVQVVDAFFDKYGSESVRALLEDMGVTSAMVVHEVRTLFEPMLGLAARTGLREAQIRQRLARFYQSDLARSLLEVQASSAALHDD